VVEKPIEILVFSTLFPHSGEPTLGIFVENRLRKLVASGRVNATVVAPVPWFPFGAKFFGKYGRMTKAKKLEERSGLKVYHPRYIVIPKVGMRITPFFMFLAARRCIKKLFNDGYRPELIDAHYLYPDGVVASKLSSELDVPFVLTARGSDVTEIAQIPGPREEVCRAVDLAEHTITVSENLRRDLISFGASAPKVTTLRNGVDLSHFRDMGRTHYENKWGDGPIMLFAGWLIPRKRLDLVLEVTVRIPGLVTLIVGDGPLLEELKAKTILLGLESRVFFLGQRAPSEMPLLYSAADLLFLASDREGCANVLLEAMACGTPVVARAIGAAPDLIDNRDGGRVVDSEDPDDLAKAVQGLISNLPSRQKTRAFACQFDWTNTTNGQIKIFEAIMATREQRKKGDEIAQ